MLTLNKWCEEINKNEVLNIPFFNWLASRGLITEKMLRFVKNAIKISHEIYPHKWDVQLMAYVHLSDNSVHVVDSIHDNFGGDKIGIRFIYDIGDVVMNTEYEAKHLVRGLFATLNFINDERNQNSSRLYSISGFRTLMGHDEYGISWYHSHMSTINYEGRNGHKLCLGTGILNSAKNNLNITLQNMNPDMNIFKMLLFAIPTYYSWESKEGGPFYYLSDLHTHYKKYTNENRVPEDMLMKIYQKIRREYIETIVHGIDVYEVKLKDEFFHNVLPTINDQFKKTDSIFIKSKHNKVHEYRRTFSNDITKEYTVSQNEFFYKGQYPEIKVIPSYTMDIYNEQSMISPTLRNDIEQGISKIFNQKLLHKWHNEKTKLRLK